MIPKKKYFLTTLLKKIIWIQLLESPIEVVLCDKINPIPKLLNWMS
jgi:hypothetical protein